MKIKSKLSKVDILVLFVMLLIILALWAKVSLGFALVITLVFGRVFGEMIKEGV